MRTPLHSQSWSLRLAAVLTLAAPTASAQCDEAWSAIGSGPTGSVLAWLPQPDGTLLAAGAFPTGPLSGTSLYRWDGTSWAPFPGNVSGLGFSLARLRDDSFVVGGTITSAGGAPVNFIARWDGTAWSGLGSGLTGTIFNIPRALLVLTNGDLVAGGNFPMAGGVTVNGIARWDGAAWFPLGGGMGASGDVHALAELPNGDLIAGGSFTTAGGTASSNIARWNGVAWSPLAGGTDATVQALAIMPNGDLIAGGSFTQAGGQPASRIARWNGAEWSSLGTGIVGGGVRALHVLPSGDLVAGGHFSEAGGVPVDHIARWDGSGWSAFVSGTDDAVFALATKTDGTLLVGGSFMHAGGVAAPFAAELATTCPASSAVATAGCPSAGAGDTLSAITLPWLNSVFRTRAAGLPSNALVVVATGFATLMTPTPLDTILPIGAPGCEVHVRGDILDMVETTSGIADWDIFIPAIPPIVGMHFFHQMMPIERSTDHVWLSVTATNTLDLTVGMF